MISHVALIVSDLERSERFYLETLALLGFIKADSVAGEYTRLTNGRDTVIVLAPVEERFSGVRHHRKCIGLNHLALRAESRQQIDAVEQRLLDLGVRLLGEGKVDTEYRGEYYTLAFQDPDKIMVEIVYHGEQYFTRVVT